MLSQSHSVNTSIESCPFCCDKKNRSHNQKKSHSVNEPLGCVYTELLAMALAIAMQNLLSGHG